MRERMKGGKGRNEEKGLRRGSAVPCPWVKIKQLLIILLSCYAHLFLTAPASAASPAKAIKEGNRYYNQEKYDEALEKYKAAGEEAPDSDIVNFNAGAAQYKKGLYQEAIDSFTKALNTEDKKTEADAIYNIANSKYKLGSVNVEQDLNMAVSQYREAIDYYKRAIELDEKNRDAKYNHELVERELKVLLEKQEKQQQQQQQDGQDKDKKDKEEGEESQAKSDEEKKEEDKQQQEAGSEQDIKEDQEDPSAKEDSEQQPEESREMTPEEAKMLLDAYGEEEERDAMKKQKKGYYPEVMKDW